MSVTLADRDVTKQHAEIMMTPVEGLFLQLVGGVMSTLSAVEVWRFIFRSFRR